jgi:hypothetical protein
MRFSAAERAALSRWVANDLATTCDADGAAMGDLVVTLLEGADDARVALAEGSEAELELAGFLGADTNSFMQRLLSALEGKR